MNLGVRLLNGDEYCNSDWPFAHKKEMGATRYDYPLKHEMTTYRDVYHTVCGLEENDQVL